MFLTPLQIGSDTFSVTAFFLFHYFNQNFSADKDLGHKFSKDFLSNPVEIVFHGNYANSADIH